MPDDNSERDIHQGTRNIMMWGVMVTFVIFVALVGMSVVGVVTAP